MNDIKTSSENCQVCGSEHSLNDLKTIKLSSLNTSLMMICSTCSQQSAEVSFKNAAEIINDIINIAKTKEDPESRLKSIMEILGK